MSLSFPRPLARVVLNHRKGVAYTLAPLDEVVASPEAASQIVAICNQPAIYEMLFAANAQGEPYSLAKAEGFLTWARQGWAESTHFVFLILSPAGDVAGALDIKSANLTAGEIGYWLSADHSGVMTNAVKALATIAEQAGYQSLYAWVQAHNEKSKAVLRRSGFTAAGGETRDDGYFERFTRSLSPAGAPPAGA